jgi:hypothetical protein
VREEIRAFREKEQAAQREQRRGPGQATP